MFKYFLILFPLNILVSNQVTECINQLISRNMMFLRLLWWIKSVFLDISEGYLSNGMRDFIYKLRRYGICGNL